MNKCMYDYGRAGDEEKRDEPYRRQRLMCIRDGVRAGTSAGMAVRMIIGAP